MLLALHTASIMHTNVATDVRVAREAGYGGIELLIPKVTRYLDAGYTVDDLAGAVGDLRVTMLDVLLSVERTDPGFRRGLLEECRRMAAVAEALGCGALQVVALDDFPTDDWPAQRRTLVSSLNELADVASGHGVRLGIEPVTFSPFRTVPQALEVIDEVGPERAGLVLDTWHLWTSGEGWQHLADLDPDLIVCVQLGDTSPMSGASWSDADRTALLGDGIVPLAEGVDAIRSCGFDGTWSVEMHSRRHWEWEPGLLASELLGRARRLLEA